MPGNAGTAVFEAVGRFGGLINESKKAKDALAGVKEEAKGLGTAVPANGGPAGSGLASIATRAGTLSQQMSGFGSTMTKNVTAPVGLLGGIAVKSFATFETAIVSAGQKAGASKTELAEMKQLALDMGNQTKFSAGEAADGLDILAAKGFNAKDAMDALPGVMKAAQAANEDLGLTTDVVASALNAFGLEAKDSTHVADVLTQAANTTSLSMQDLADGLAQAGEVGPRFGQSLEDVTGWLGRLRDMGVPAASGGTAIRQALVSLAAPTGKAAKIMKNLGIETRDAQGNMLPIPKLLQNMQKGLAATNPEMQEAAYSSAMTTKEYADFATKAVFGAEGAKAVALAISDGKPVMLDAAKDTEKLAALQDGLAKTMGEKGAAAWIAARTEAGKFTATGADTVTALGAMGVASDGTADKFGKAFNETTAAKIDQMWGSLETLAITLVGAVAPALNGIITDLTEFVGKIADWAAANPEMAKFAVGIAVAAAALGPLLIVLAKVVQAVGVIAGAGGKVIGVFSKMGGAAGGAGKLAGVWDTIRLKAMYAADAVRSGASRIGTALSTIASRIGQAIAAAARWAAQTAAAAARAAASMAANAARIVASWVMMAAQATANAARMALAWTIGIIRQAAVAAASMAVTVARVVAGWVLMGVQSLIQAARMAAAWIIAMGPIGWIIAAIIGLVVLIIANWDKVKAVTVAIWNSVMSWLAGVWESIKAAAAAAWNWIKSTLSSVMAGIKTAITTYFNAYKAVITAVWNAIKAAASAVWNGIKAVLTGAFNAIKSAISAYFNGYKAVITAVWNAIKSAVSSAINGVRSTISSVLGGIKSAWNSAWNAMKNSVSTAMNGAKAIVDRVVSAIRGAIDSVMSKVNGAKNAVGGALKMLPGFNRGGLVPGVGNKDTFPAMLTPGEFVLTKDAVRRIGIPALAAANRGREISSSSATKRELIGVNATASRLMTSREAGQVRTARGQTGVRENVNPTSGTGTTKIYNDYSRTTIHTVINNPLPERASDSVQRRLTRTAQLGLIGGRRTGTDG